MKPLYLTIAGLNSFREEQSIDFKSLCDTGIFGIFGPTGSGKSTVLDAITLALYGKVERAKGGTHGIINQNEEKAYVSFKFSLGDRKFKAERTYKKSIEGGVNLHQCRLIEEIAGEDQVLAERKKEMEEKILEILGLNVTDFTRAVVLPQGKFAEFLTLQGSERRRMLQRLFALEQYGEQLSQKVKQRLASVSNNLEAVKARQGELGDASEKVLKEAQKALKVEEKSLQQLKERELSINKKHEDFKEIMKLQDELRETEEKKEKLDLKKPEMMVKQEKFELGLMANSLQPFLDRVTKETDFLQKVQKELQQTTVELEDVQKKYTKAQESQKYWQQQWEQRGKELEVKLFKIEEALLSEIERDQLNTSLENLREDYKTVEVSHIKQTKEMAQLEEDKKILKETKESLEKTIKEKESMLDQKEEITIIRQFWQSLEQIKNNLKELEKDKTGKELQIGTISKNKERLALEVARVSDLVLEKSGELEKSPHGSLTQIEMNQRREELNSLDKLINSLELNYQELSSKQQAIHQNHLEANKLSTSLSQYQGLKYSLNLTKETIIQDTKKIEEHYKNKERDNLAYFLRQSLTEENPCPVCGSLDHPQPIAQGVQGEDLEKINQELEAKRVELQKLEGDINNINSHLTVFQTQLDSLDKSNSNFKKESELISQRIADIRKQVREDWSQVNVEVLKEIHHKELKLLEELEKNQQEFLNKKEKTIGEINTLKDSFNTSQQKLVAEEAIEKTLLQAMEQLDERIQKIRDDYEDKTGEYLKISKGIKGEEIEGIYEGLVKTSKEMEKLVKEEKEASRKLDHLYQELLGKQTELQKIQQQIDHMKSEGIKLRDQVKQLTEKINQTTLGKKAQEVKEEAEQELKAIINNLKDASFMLEEARTFWDTKNKLYFSTQDKLSQSQVRLEEERAQLKTKLKEHNFTTQGQLEDALCSKGEIEELKEQLNEFNNVSTLIANNTKRITNELRGRELTLEHWEQFLLEKDKTQEELESALEMVYKLRDRTENLEKNHLRWNQLEEENKDLTNQADKLHQLDKLFRGHTFVEFIAEEQLMNVAIDASARLGELTHYRYALEVDSEGGFIIRDDGNGGLRRPVSTLSGGEIFLTSLALALALSSQIQLRGQYPLEFFFLDEGFGSLDNHLLETAINSLERLHSHNMTIGLISHVPELKARIARKLLVESAQKGGRGSRLSIQ